MSRKEKWAAIIASSFVIPILVFCLPLVYSVMIKLFDLPFLTNPGALMLEAREVVVQPMMYADELDSIEKTTATPKGIVKVSSERANIRSKPKVVKGNEIGETTKGNYLLYYDTEKVNDALWYRIQKRDDLAAGWISYITVKEVATSENEVDDMEPLEEFMDQYLQNVIKSIESYDFSIVEPFLLPKSAIYKEQKDYLNYLSEKQIQEELLSHRVIDAIVLEKDQIWIRTIEFYNITYGDGSVKRKDFVSEYLITVVDENEYKLNRLLGTYQQN
ncbi:TcaA NTF2-like domain-containing protein [Litchfieldia alkalitelluris]|uniref:TcaA NTF2-like domain-containing protein n=1 Tax=Litchfieldia alkalitelluris TaxID=304268 RepID=UPI000996720D|nr:hypothetical protein [Litchfieldia alkalitelluris]